MPSAMIEELEPRAFAPPGACGRSEIADYVAGHLLDGRELFRCLQTLGSRRAATSASRSSTTSRATDWCARRSRAAADRRGASG